MSFSLRGRRGGGEERFNISDWLRMASPPTAAGVSVTVETAARSSAVAACQRVLVTAAASLPVWALRRQGKRRVNIDPAPRIVANPSTRHTQRNWVAQVMRSLVKDGNAYVQLGGFDRQDYPSWGEVLPLADCRWSTVDGADRLLVRGQAVDLWPLGDVLHVKASAFLDEGALWARSPVELARESIGAGLAAERYGASFFGSGGHPSAIITSSQDLTADQAKAVKAAFMSARNGQEPAVFGAGLTYSPMQINPTDTQFLDLLRFEVEQVCRFYGVPPIMAYAAISGSSVTYANATQADLAFLKYSLKIWLADLQDAWSSLLPRPIEVRFDVDDLLQMDAPTRWATHQVAVGLGARTINEVREYEGEDPFEGDEFDRPAGQLALPV